MKHLSRTGEANVPAIIVASGFLVLCIAAAYYFIAVVPTMNNGEAMSDSSSSSSSEAMMMSSTAMMDDGSDAASSTHTMTPEEQAAYDGCINAATEAHNQRWSQACAQEKSTKESLYLACINKGNTESYCTAQFGGYQDIGSNCTLPLAKTNLLNAQYAATKKVCAQ